MKPGRISLPKRKAQHTKIKICQNQLTIIMRYKPGIFLALLLMVQTITLAQSREDRAVLNLNSDYLRFTIDTNYLSKKAFTVYTNRLFGQVATGQNTASLANFGSFDPVNGSFTFNAFTPLNWKGDTARYVPLLSIEAKGDLGSDNIARLFSNTKLNNNVDVSLKLHFPIPGLFKIGFYGSQKDLLLAQKESLMQEYHLRVMRAKAAFYLAKEDSMKLRTKLQLVEKKIGKERDTIKHFKNLIESLVLTDPANVDSLTVLTNGLSRNREEMQILISDSFSTKLKVDSVTLITRKLNDDRIGENEWRVIRKSLQDKYADTLLNLELAAPITKVRLLWFSAVGTFNQKKFWFYDELKPFEDRISRLPFSSFNIGGELNYYSQKLRSRHAHYITIGLKRKQDNNIADLSTSTINQKNKSAGGTVEREIVNSYSAYTDPVIEYKAWFLYANYYFMFRYNALSAIHLFPELDSRTYKDGTKKSYKNLGLGYVISLKDSKKEKSILNVEAYYKLVDMDNQEESEKGLFGRNEIGLRLGFPLNFVINPK